jgi:hypothetical protein
MRALQPAEANDGNFAWADLDERIRLAPGDATPRLLGCNDSRRRLRPVCNDMVANRLAWTAFFQESREHIRCRGNSTRPWKHPRARWLRVESVAGLHSCSPTVGRGLRSHGIGLFPASRSGIVSIGTICPDMEDPTNTRSSARRSMCKEWYSPRCLRIGHRATHRCRP